MPVCMLKAKRLFFLHFFTQFCISKEIWILLWFIAKFCFRFKFFIILCPKLENHFIKTKPWTVECGTAASERLWALTSQYYWAAETRKKQGWHVDIATQHLSSRWLLIQSSMFAGPRVSSLRRSRLISSAANTSRRRSVFISSGMYTVFYSCKSWAS